MADHCCGEPFLQRGELVATRSVMLAVAALVSGCATHADAPPFNVVIRTDGSSCTTIVDGHAVTSDELAAIARQRSKLTRRVHIDADGTTPYRCLGGVVFALQGSGFENVGFTAEPPPADRN